MKTTWLRFKIKENNMEIIDDEEKIKKICEEEHLLYNSINLRQVFGMLRTYYESLPQSVQDEWILFAKSIKTPNYKYGLRKRLKRSNLRYARTYLMGSASGIFIRLNQMGIVRKIINEPRINTPTCIPAVSPPSALYASAIREGILLSWQDYTPPCEPFSHLKKVNIFFTLYCGYYLSINNKNFDVRSKIVTVLTQPTKERFLLRYLVLPYNKLIKLQDIPQVTIRFQMDTILLADDYAPVISYLSGEAEVQWNKEGVSKLHKITEEFARISPENELIKGTNPRYIKSTRLILQPGNASIKYKEEKIYAQ